jgi:hypothetical protein
MGAPAVAVFAVVAACAPQHRPVQDGETRIESKRTAADAGHSSVLGVPRARVPIVPTGRFDVGIWAGAAQTRTLLDTKGRGAVPVSEARFLWGDGQLYVFFYAADLDLEARASKHDDAVWKDDSVALTFFSPGTGRLIVQISPRGVVADGICPLEATDLGDPRCDLTWESGARVGVDADGTFNQLGDFDEEWAVEAALPLASLHVDGAGPGTRIRFAVSRCEIAHDGPRACGTWGGSDAVLVLE